MYAAAYHFTKPTENHNVSFLGKDICLGFGSKKEFLTLFPFI